MTTTDTTTTTAPLQDQTPAQIDAELSRLGYQRAVLFARVDGLRVAAAQARKSRHPNPTRADHLEAQADQYGPQIAELTEQMRPYHDEYDRRGGWPRAYLVQSNNGHVHSSTNCSTCFITTQYAWLTDYSGKTEEEIVWAAGELGCSVCYPSAPSNALNRVGEIRRLSDVEREQRAAEKTANAQAAAAAAVIDPDTGKTLYKTDRAATNEISSALWNLRWYGGDHPSAAQWKQAVSAAVNALAAKQDTDPAALMAEYEAKADKKFNADARKALRDIKQHGGHIVVDNLMPALQAWVQANGIPA